MKFEEFLRNRQLHVEYLSQKNLIDLANTWHELELDNISPGLDEIELVLRSVIPNIPKIEPEILKNPLFTGCWGTGIDKVAQAIDILIKRGMK